MPAQSAFLNTATKIAGIINEYNKVYFPKYKGSMDSFVKYFMSMGGVQKNLTDTFGYVESVRGARLIRRGEGIPKSAARTISWTADLKEYGGGIDVHYLDAKYDNLDVLYAQARNIAAKNALVAEKVLISYLTGTVNADVIDALENAPDGAAMYATTAESANRFGISGGNIVASQVVTSPIGIQNAIYAATVRAAGFQDTVGDVLWDASTLDQGMFILHSSADEQNFAKATEGQLLLESLATGGTTDYVGGAVTNILMNANKKIKRFGTQYLSTGTWFMVLMGIPDEGKPIHRRTGEDFKEQFYNASNDRQSFESGYEMFGWRGSFSWGIDMPLATIKVTT